MWQTNICGRVQRRPSNRTVVDRPQQPIFASNYEAIKIKAKKKLNYTENQCIAPEEQCLFQERVVQAKGRQECLPMNYVGSSIGLMLTTAM